MKTRLLPIFLTLVLLFASIPSYVLAEVPAIEVFTPPSSRSYPLKIYVYPQAFRDEKSMEPFQCPSTQNIIATFHEVLRGFRGSITRFVDEHPEYHELAQIDFINASSPDEADIVFKVVTLMSSNPSSLGVTFYTPGHAEIAVVCGLADRGSVATFNVIFHEFMHALGLGHARQSTCGDGSLELMWPTTASRMRMYPSTLDLYALHQLLFKGAREAITLPRNLRYEMVLPYQYEIQVLKEENERLKTALDASAAELRKAQQSQTTLLDKLKQANATIQSQRQQLDSLGNDIIMVKQALRDHDAKLANVSRELSAVERFMLNKSAEVDHKFKLVAAILQETWLALQGLQNETAAQAGRMAAAERGIASLNLLFILVLCFMAAVLAAFIYLARRLAALESRVLRGESCLESGGESG